VEDADKIIFLTNIGLLYKDDDTKKAKEYFERALSYGEHPGTIEHLADVYYAEGNKEEAYRLWKKALTIEGRFEKDDLIHSILSYDLEHGNLEEASRNLDEIISIKDSMLYLLRNDTIKDLQLRFDHEMAMHEADKKLISTQRILMTLAFFVGVLVFYIYYRRKKEETLEKEHQMQLYAYTTEINELKTNKEKALAEIKDLQSNNEKDSLRINELEENAQNAEAAIEKLNKEIKKLLDDKSPKLKHGRILYDRIMDGEHAGKWSSEEQDLFNYYYAATNYHRWNRLRRVKRAKETNPHNMFYLILKDMGMSDEEVKRIMVLSQEGLRSMRNRTKPIE
jgi:tetratricopeptide (TPR) repeat protein